MVKFVYFYMILSLAEMWKNKNHSPYLARVIRGQMTGNLSKITEGFCFHVSVLSFIFSMILGQNTVGQSRRCNSGTAHTCLVILHECLTLSPCRVLSRTPSTSETLCKIYLQRTKRLLLWDKTTAMLQWVCLSNLSSFNCSPQKNQVQPTNS